VYKVRRQDRLRFYGPTTTAKENTGPISVLAERYTDRSPDLAHLCLIRMRELHPRYPVITTDLKNFSRYRRGRRDAIALIHP